jgi:putative membrane protein
VSAPESAPESEPESEPARRRYRRLSPLTPLVRGFILLVAVLASTWDDLLRGDLGPFAWLLLAILAAGGAYGAASWLRTRYWIEADELRVDTGVISRQSRRIRVDRLQGVDIVQPFVARIFGLAELRMDVAGGSAREGSLAFLPVRDAEALRETLLSRRDAVRTGRERTAAGTDGSAVAAPEAELARLDLGTLLVSLLLSVETVLFLLAAALVAAAFLVFGQLGGVAGVVPVVIGFALTQLRKLSAYYDFTLSTVGDTAGATGRPPAVRVRRGLFERSSQTIALARVQGVVVSEPLLWRHLGWARLDVAVAGYAGGGQGHDNGPSASTVMPVAPRRLVLALARTLLTGSFPAAPASGPGPDPDAVPLTPPPTRARWTAPVSRRFLAGGLGEDLAVAREGIWTRRTHVVPHARVQSLRLRQGPWQRRLGLVDLRVDSPPGPVALRMRHRDAAEVRGLLEREDALARAARLSSAG